MKIRLTINDGDRSHTTALTDFLDFNHLKSKVDTDYFSNLLRLMRTSLLHSENQIVAGNHQMKI